MVFLKENIHAGNVFHRVCKTFPYAAGTVGSREPTNPHIFKQCPLPVGNNQSVKYHHLVM
jgi:hypothetical protein